MIMKIPKLRGQYSDRNGISPISTEMQFDDLDHETRVYIRNILKIYLNSKIYRKPTEQVFLKSIYAYVFVVPIDNFIEYYRFFEDVEAIIYEGTIYQIFDILEGIYKYLESSEGYQENINIVFEKNYVGYRFINGCITKITSKEEIDSVNEAAQSNDKVSSHLNKAIAYLSNRENPDYENSIKESISAVEAMCEIILGGKRVTRRSTYKTIPKQNNYTQIFI